MFLKTTASANANHVPSVNWIQIHTKMKGTVILSLIIAIHIGSLQCISVGDFMKSYMSASSEAVRKALIQDMLGSFNEKPIQEIFEDYNVNPDDQYHTRKMLKDRDFLKTQDREYLDHILKYTKVANSKWGQILLHPERLPDPASILQWDMKALVKNLVMNPKLRTRILGRFYRNKTMMKKLKDEINTRVKDPMVQEMLSIHLDEAQEENQFSDQTFFVPDNDTCVDQLAATYGYPVDGLLQIIELIVVQIVQTIFAEVDGLCSTADGDPGAWIAPIICLIAGFSDENCDRFITSYPLACLGASVAVSLYEVEPLRRQPAIILIPTIAMLDASAKIPSGILELKLHWPGDFQLCENIFGEYNSSFTNKLEPFTGKYCRIDIGFAQDGSDTPDGETPWGLPVGICVPNACGKTDGGRQYIQERLSEPLGILGLGVVNVFCGHDENLADNQKALTALGVIAVIAVIAMLATIWDGFFRKAWLAKRFGLIGIGHGAEPYQKSGKGSASFKVNRVDDVRPSGEIKHQFSLKSADVELTSPVGCSDRVEAAFTGFSFYSNLRKIFTANTPKRDFAAIHFLRFFSLCYLMLGETYFLGTLFTEIWAVGNFLSFIMSLPRLWYFQPILNVHFVADTFFAISGFLACYWWLKRVDKIKGSPKIIVQVIRFVLHKYFVLMIPMMLTLMFYATWYKFLLGGPLAPIKIDDAEFCFKNDNWWTNLLLIHNLQNRVEKCVSWTWYLACVFQLHLATLVAVLIPLALGRYGKYLGYFMIFAMWGAHVGITADYALKYYSLANFDIEAWYRDMLQLPWNRAGAYLMGTTFGIIMFNIRRKKIKLHWIVDLVGWLTSICAIAAISFSTYDMVKEEGSGPVLWSEARLICWEVLSRSAWAICICWMIFSIHCGGGGILHCLINWKIWLPLSRLTYTAYLIHAVITLRFIYAQMSLVEITQDNMWYYFFGNLIFSLAAGIVISLLFQLPFVNFEAAMFYIKSKGAAMMFGRNPYEDVDIDITQLDDPDDYAATANGVDNLAMTQYHDGEFNEPTYKRTTFSTAPDENKRHENVYQNGEPNNSTTGL